MVLLDLALRPFAARAWATALAASLPTGIVIVRHRRANSSIRHSPMNDDATITLAAFCASLKTDSAWVWPR